MNENCTGCLYSEDSQTLTMIDDLLTKYGHQHNKSMKCVHENSPYFDEIVNDSMCCRLYVDAQEYFKMKDRKEALQRLKNRL